MACSLAQLEANKRNATRSSGPRTPQGKIRSRANSYKHGLTGEGIVLPTEEAAEVDLLIGEFEADMKPKTAMARKLVARLALLTLRLERSAKQEAKAISLKMRRASAEFSDARLAEVENLYSWIGAEPATNARRLRATPEGIDRLIASMEGLLGELGHSDGAIWGWQQCEHLHHLMGLRPLDVPISRPKALSDAMTGNFQHLRQADRPELEKIQRQCWAANQLLQWIEAEIAALKERKEGLDLEGLELDRAEAPERAMFDDSKEAILSRKYEATSERGLFRTLRELREIQAEAPEVEAAPEVTPEPAGELGSSFPDAPGGEIAGGIGDPIDPGVVAGPEKPVDGAAFEAEGGGSVDLRGRPPGGNSRPDPR